MVWHTLGCRWRRQLPDIRVANNHAACGVSDSWQYGRGTRCRTNNPSLCRIIYCEMCKKCLGRGQILLHNVRNGKRSRMRAYSVASQYVLVRISVRRRRRRRRMNWTCNTHGEQEINQKPCLHILNKGDPLGNPCIDG